MNENGFKVNEDFQLNSKVRKKSKKKKRASFLKGVAVLLLILIVGIIFCATVPVFNVTKVVSCEITNNNGNSEINYYNNDGNIEKKVYYYQGMETGFTIFTYDADGNILKEEASFEGELVNIITYTYNNGLMTRAESKDASGFLISYSDFQYNDDKTLTLKITYNELGEAVTQYNYTYVAGRLVSENVLYFANNYSEKITYTYEGRYMTKELSKSDIGEKETVYTYDNHGRILTKKVKNADYLVYKYEYKTEKVTFFESIKQ